MFLSALYYYFHSLKEKKETIQSYLMQFSLIFVLSILLMKIVSLFHVYSLSEYYFCFSGSNGRHAFKILINEKLAILFTISMAICGRYKSFYDGV